MTKPLSLLAAVVCAASPIDAFAQAGGADRPTTTNTTTTTPGAVRDADDDDDDKDYGWIGLLGLLGLAGLMRRPHTDRVVGTTTTRADVRH